MRAVTHTSGRRLISAAMALPLLLLVLAATSLPPMLSFSLIERGMSENRLTWIAFGGCAGAAWLFGFYLTVRSLRASRSASDPASADLARR